MPIIVIRLKATHFCYILKNLCLKETKRERERESKRESERESKRENEREREYMFV